MSILEDNSLFVGNPIWEPVDYYKLASIRLEERGVHEFSYGEMEKATSNFDEEMVLGSGGEGKVFKGVLYDHLHAHSNITVAVKVFARKLEWNTYSTIATDLAPPNIVSVVGFCNESPDHPIVVYEYMANGSLADILKLSSEPFTWPRRLYIASDVAFALRHLHTGNADFPDGIVHRDVKPSNILLDRNYRAKISDFGLMKVCPPPRQDNSEYIKPKGTPGYIPPECLTNHRITNKVDVYSYGMVLFELLCRKSPWKCPGKESFYPQDDDNFVDLALENIDPNIRLEISRDCLKVYTDLICKTLRQNPAERPTMRQVELELEIALKLQQQHDLQQRISSDTVPMEPRSEDLSRGCQFESAEVSAAIPANPLIF